MLLIKKILKPSLSQTKTRSYLFSCEDYEWVIEEDAITDLWNIYLNHDESKSYIGSRPDFKLAKTFVALNAEYLIQQYVE